MANASSAPEESLSNEILAQIFICVSAPTAFSLVSKRWRAVATDPYNVAQRWIHLRGKSDALSAALATKTLSPAVLSKLIAGGAIFSHNLFALFQGAYTGLIDPTRWSLPKLWGLREERVSGATWDAILGLAASRDWPTAPFSIVDLDRLLAVVHEVTANYINLPAPSLENRENLEVMLEQAHKAIVSQRFVPLEDNSPLVPRAACLEPRLLEWLKTVDYRFDAKKKDRLAVSVLATRHPPLSGHAIGGYTTIVGGQLMPDSRTNIVTRTLRTYMARSQGVFQVSPTVCGRLLLDYDTLHEYAEPLLDMRDNLQFPLAAIASDLLRLAHNTRTSFSRSQWIISLYFTFIAPDPVLSKDVHLLGMVARALFSSPDPNTGASSPRIDKAPHTADLSNEKLTEILVEVLCEEFLCSPEPILLLHADSERLDIPEATRRAAIRMVRMPSKGSTLLSLVTRDPFLLSVVRSEILSHRIDLSRLPTASARDPSRPLYAHPSAFLSPLAFDYDHAYERWPLGLGPEPWREEGCYQVPRRKEEGEGSGVKVAQSVWPLEMEEYEWVQKEGDKKVNVVKLGKVTGEPLVERQGTTKEGKAVVEWIWERVPVAGSLPVAIAALDMFDVTDEALDVLLMHAILNLNPSVTHFYLKEGVPLRDHHLAAADRLGLPRLEAINQHLEGRRLLERIALDPREGEGERRKRKCRGRKRTKKGGAKGREDLTGGAMDVSS